MMPSRLVIAFLPRSKHLLISWLQSSSVMILEPKKIVCHYFHCFPSICHEVMGCIPILVFWMLSFKPAFLVSCFSFIKRLFSYSSLSAVRVVLSAYLRLLIFLPAILIPACASSNLLKQIRSLGLTHTYWSEVKWSVSHPVSYWWVGHDSGSWWFSG